MRRPQGLAYTRGCGKAVLARLTLDKGNGAHGRTALGGLDCFVVAFKSSVTPTGAILLRATERLPRAFADRLDGYCFCRRTVGPKALLSKASDDCSLLDSGSSATLPGFLAPDQLWTWGLAIRLVLEQLHRKWLRTPRRFLVTGFSIS